MFYAFFQQVYLTVTYRVRTVANVLFFVLKIKIYYWLIDWLADWLSDSKKSPQNGLKTDDNDIEISKERYISPEKKTANYRWIKINIIR